MPNTGTLIACDLVCSGVASRLAWRSYLNALERQHGKVVGYEHRPKVPTEGRIDRSTERAFTEDGSVVGGSRLVRSWRRVYVGRWNLRPTCHDCPYHSMNRPGDITLGDFWGIRELAGWNEGEGVSLVLPNVDSLEVARLVDGLLTHSDWAAFPAEAACNPRQPRLSSSPEPNAVRRAYLSAAARSGHTAAFRKALAQAGVRKALRKQHVPGAAETLCSEQVIDTCGNALANRLVAQKGDCYGCGVCSAICPKGAISMEEDAEGFPYPRIDEQDCIDCGLCERVCPRRATTTTDPQGPQASTAYAVRLKDEDAFMHSSSGGAFWGIAEQVLKQGWVVYGVAFDDQMMPRHVRCETTDQCMACMGSKYAQADTGHCYASVVDDLRAGRSVLFTGTPCHVAALKRFLTLAAPARSV